jgi:hypothetical protein
MNRFFSNKLCQKAKILQYVLHFDSLRYDVRHLSNNDLPAPSTSFCETKLQRLRFVIFPVMSSPKNNHFQFMKYRLP